MSGKLQVKNRAPAPIQISAEQLLREAKERGLEEAPPPPKQFITDSEELRLYQQNKRKEFEDALRRQRQKIPLWIKYGEWEASQREYERARSVFERALDIDYRSQAVWLKYSEMELKNKFLNHARNVLDRAVTLLPRNEIFWFKYTYMEEFIGAINECRLVFERWMKWEPSDNCWLSYIKFEIRQGNIANARNVYERYIKCFPTAFAYLKYAKWEEKNNREYAKAREIYERSLIEIHPMERSVKLYTNFASFEERCKEYDRARIIYQYAIENIESIAIKSSNQAAKEEEEGLDSIKTKEEINQENEVNELRQSLLNFEKKYGNKQSIEEVILSRRRSYYEEEIANDSYNYDHWFNYILMEENEPNNEERVRELYERAVSFVPPINEKRYWRRYIYLWIYYAVYEELQAKDVDRTRAVYQACLSIIPHKSFTFGKIWLYAAQFEIRQSDFQAARRILGRGIGMCGKENIFKGYIEMELQLGEIDRCRTIYSKFIETMPWNSSAWKNYAQLETNLGETERARGIYELAIKQSELDMPELLWKTYIDFEINEGEYDLARKLYERLLEKTTHVKVWISYAQFEGSLSGEDNEIDAKCIQTVRKVMNRGYSTLKSQGLKEERVLLLEAWRELEMKAVLDHRDIATVESKFPRKIKMRRPIPRENIDTNNREDEEAHDDVEFEEYYEYQFPDDVTKLAGLKLLENAMKWKKAAATGSSVDMENKDETGGDLSGVLGGHGHALNKRKHQDDGDDELHLPPKRPHTEPSQQPKDANEIDLDI